MYFLKRLLLAVALSACSESAIAQETPQPTEHDAPLWASPWGEQDRLGAQTAPEGAAYVTAVYQVERTLGLNEDFTLNGSQRGTSFDEKIVSSTGIGTQIDGVGHLGVEYHCT